MSRKLYLGCMAVNAFSMGGLAVHMLLIDGQSIAAACFFIAAYFCAAELKP